VCIVANTFFTHPHDDHAIVSQCFDGLMRDRRAGAKQQQRQRRRRDHRAPLLAEELDSLLRLLDASALQIEIAQSVAKLGQFM
jgi:hypothetical protein